MYIGGLCTDKGHILGVFGLNIIIDSNSLMITTSARFSNVHKHICAGSFRIDRQQNGSSDSASQHIHVLNLQEV